MTYCCWPSSALVAGDRDIESMFFLKSGASFAGQRYWLFDNPFIWSYAWPEGAATASHDFFSDAWCFLLSEALSWEILAESIVSPEMCRRAEAIPG